MVPEDFYKTKTWHKVELQSKKEAAANTVDKRNEKTGFNYVIKAIGI